MSWSVQLQGKLDLVTASIQTQFDNIKCEGPESRLKDKARELVMALLAAQPAGSAVSVMASGTAASKPVYASDDPRQVVGWEQTSQSLTLKVEPIWGLWE